MLLAIFSHPGFVGKKWHPIENLTYRGRWGSRDKKRQESWYEDLPGRGTWAMGAHRDVDCMPNISTDTVLHQSKVVPPSHCGSLTWAWGKLDQSWAVFNVKHLKNGLALDLKLSGACTNWPCIQLHVYSSRALLGSVAQRRTRCVFDHPLDLIAVFFQINKEYHLSLFRWELANAESPDWRQCQWNIRAQTSVLRKGSNKFGISSQTQNDICQA